MSGVMVPVPMPTTGTDLEPIHDAMARLAHRLGGGLAVDKCKRFATNLMIKGVGDVGLFKHRKYTAKQVDQMLKDIDAPDGEDGWRATIEHVFSMEFAICALPTGLVQSGGGGQLVVPVNHIRPSRYLYPGDNQMLGTFLTANQVLDDVCISPLTIGLLDTVNYKTSAIQPHEFRAIIAEQVIFTLKFYSCVNVDVVYLTRLASKLNEAIPHMPAGKTAYKGLYNKFTNSRKTGAKVSAPWHHACTARTPARACAPLARTQPPQARAPSSFSAGSSVAAPLTDHWDAATR